MDQIRTRLISDLQAAGKYLYANALTWGNAGNLSARLDSTTILVSASGTNLGDLSTDDFVEVPIAASAGEIYPRKPTKELPMHRAVYAIRPEVHAVVHASPFFTTLVSCSGEAIPSGLFVESMYYLERVARVGYAHPGSARLGELVQEQVAHANLLLMENHGVLAYDTSLKEALMGLHTYELAAKMVLEARAAGVSLRVLPQPIVEDFLNNSGYRPRRK
jgi:3-dehydro-4-phosphotetronate decarboxylase